VPVEGLSGVRPAGRRPSAWNADVYRSERRGR
jgi:hypothetical protein